MIHAARASAARVIARPSPNQSLAKHNRKSSQLIENIQHGPNTIASFLHVFSDDRLPQVPRIKPRKARIP